MEFLLHYTPFFITISSSCPLLTQLVPRSRLTASVILKQVPRLSVSRAPSLCLATRLHFLL